MAPSSLTSPLELLEQLERTRKLEEEAQTATIVVSDVSNLPKGRELYRKKLNIFYREGKIGVVLEDARTDLEIKKRAHKEVHFLHPRTTFCTIFSCVFSCVRVIARVYLKEGREGEGQKMR